MDLKTCIFVLKNLARMHVSSMLVLEEHPEWRNELLEYNYWADKVNSVTNPLLEKGLKAFADEAETWKEFPKEWLDRIKNLMKGDPFDYMIECHKYRENGLNVLCHGDCWANNIMVKTDAENTVTE